MLLFLYIPTYLESLKKLSFLKQIRERELFSLHLQMSKQLHMKTKYEEYDYIIILTLWLIAICHGIRMCY